MTYTPIPKGTENWDVPLNAALSQLDSNITASSGTALQRANNLSDLTNPAQARSNLGLTGLANALSNMTATTNPAVTSDSTQGYSIGSTWFNTTTNAMFVASSVAVGAAVWLQIPPTFVDRTTTQTVAGVKTFTSTLQTSQGTATNSAITAAVTGDTQARFNVRMDGQLEWGPGGSTARDINLYRGNSTTLVTDDEFQAANFTPAGWIPYTPTWTTSGTAPSIGNGTLTGRYAISGNTVNVVINLIAGSTTTFGTNGQSFSLPIQAANQTVSYVGHAHLLDTTRWGGQCIASPNASNTAPFFPASATDTRLTGLTNAVPQTLTTAAQIRLSLAYEIA
jgi:hypothetical protein